MPRPLTLPEDGLTGFLQLVTQLNSFDPTDYLPFYVGKVCVGMVQASFATMLKGFATVFVITEASVRLHPALVEPADRTEAVADVFTLLRDTGMLPEWRGENFPITVHWSDPPLFELERTAHRFLGMRSYSVHVNGYVRRTDGLCYWVARRSQKKKEFPLKLDQLVAGGQPVGGNVFQTVLKECEAEAGIKRSLSETAIPVGTVSFTCEVKGQMLPHTCFIYDLELPAGFQPILKKHIVDEFLLLPIQKVCDSVISSSRTQEWKPNCALVAIDFLIRHGFLSPTTAQYPELVASLHCPYAAGLTTVFSTHGKLGLRPTDSPVLGPHGTPQGESPPKVSISGGGGGCGDSARGGASTGAANGVAGNPPNGFHSLAREAVRVLDEG